MTDEAQAADPAVIVVLPREIDVTNASQVADMLRGQPVAGGAVVIADLTGTDFCDSAGIRTLTLAHQRAEAGGTELRLAVTAGGPVMRVLELLELVRLLQIYRSVEAAVAGEPGSRVG